MRRTALLQEVRLMRFETLLDRHERGARCHVVVSRRGATVLRTISGSRHRLAPRTHRHGAKLAVALS